MDKEHNLLGVVKVLVTWKRQILIATVAAGVIAAVYSYFFMDDYYKSAAIVYPVNLAYNDRAAIFAGEHADYYAGKDDENRILTILQSGPVSNSIIEKFNLADHYKINKNKKYWRTKVKKEFEENYKSIKTDQGAIEITVYDTDPKVAMDIVNNIITLTDSIYRGTILDAKKQQVEILDKQLKENQRFVESYNDTLVTLAKLYKITIRAGTDHTDIVDGTDYKGVQTYRTLYARQKNAAGEINFKTNLKEQIENTLDNDTKSLSIVDAPTLAEKKEKPIRSLIVLTVMLLAFVMSIFGALLADQVQDIRRQL